MKIEKKIKAVLKKDYNKLQTDKNFIKLEQFYKQALEIGFAKKPEYNLPLTDTIGRDLENYFHQKGNLKTDETIY